MSNKYNYFSAYIEIIYITFYKMIIGISFDRSYLNNDIRIYNEKTYID